MECPRARRYRERYRSNGWFTRAMARASRSNRSSSGRWTPRAEVSTLMATDRSRRESSCVDPRHPSGSNQGDNLVRPIRLLTSSGMSLTSRRRPAGAPPRCALRRSRPRAAMRNRWSSRCAGFVLGQLSIDYGHWPRRWRFYRSGPAHSREAQPARPLPRVARPAPARRSTRAPRPSFLACEPKQLLCTSHPPDRPPRDIA